MAWAPCSVSTVARKKVTHKNVSRSAVLDVKQQLGHIGVNLMLLHWARNHACYVWLSLCSFSWVTTYPIFQILNPFIITGLNQPAQCKHVLYFQISLLLSLSSLFNLNKYSSFRLVVPFERSQSLQRPFRDTEIPERKIAFNLNSLRDEGIVTCLHKAKLSAVISVLSPLPLCKVKPLRSVFLSDLRCSPIRCWRSQTTTDLFGRCPLWQAWCLVAHRLTPLLVAKVEHFCQIFFFLSVPLRWCTSVLTRQMTSE